MAHTITLCANDFFFIRTIMPSDQRRFDTLE